MGKQKYALYRYQPEKLDEIVAEGFTLFGTADKIRKNAIVMIKPNLVSDVPEYIANGCNTDVRLIEAVLKFLSNFEADVVIAESETGSQVKGRRLQRALDHMGVRALTSKYRFRVVNLTYDQQTPVTFDDGLLLKRLNLGNTSLAADLIINMPKLKTHKYATITCALKNMFGCIPDPLRVLYHHNIHKAIADINSLFIDRTFVVLDGIRCMEGQGPIFGSAIDMNLAGFCDDMLVNDVVCSRIMGFDPGTVKHIQLFRRRYHNIPLEQIEMIGPLRIEDVRRPFVPSRKNWFIRIEEQLMRNRWAVRVLFSKFFQRHITYHVRGPLKRLRGGSYSWYADEGFADRNEQN
jgi:uncharacterized protein (DUF362 family)